MKPRGKNVPNEGPLYTLPVSQLRDLYFGTVEELRQCADYTPKNMSEDLSLDKKEALLLDFESQILESASKVTLRSSDDIRLIIEIWSKLSHANNADVLTLSDRIVLNVFNQLSRQCL